MDLYMKDVQFFKQFNVAWIFSWECRLQPFLPNPYPLSLVRIYKVKWWPEFKTRLRGKENVEHFCRTNKKKFYPSQFTFVRKIKAYCTNNTSQKGEERTKFILLHKNQIQRFITKGKRSPSIF